MLVREILLPAVAFPCAGFGLCYHHVAHPDVQWASHQTNKIQIVIGIDVLQLKVTAGYAHPVPGLNVHLGVLPLCQEIDLDTVL